MNQDLNGHNKDKVQDNNLKNHFLDNHNMAQDLNGHNKDLAQDKNLKDQALNNHNTIGDLDHNTRDLVPNKLLKDLDRLILNKNRIRSSSDQRDLRLQQLKIHPLAEKDLNDSMAED